MNSCPASAATPDSTRRILGVDFFVGTLDAAVALVLPETAPLSTLNPQLSTLDAPPSLLVVAPSGPGLAVDLVHAPPYRCALQTADLVLTDSGFMVLLWWLLTGERLPRHSGLKFLRAVLALPSLKKPGAIFWVMPSAEEAGRNQTWLRAQGFAVTSDDIYIAPAYPATGELNDSTLVARIETRRPQVVMLAIGGGVQERLGMALRTRLSCKSTIMCLGAAIAFLTGGQAAIPPWADRLMLGWLLRLLYNPRKFWRRYWDALKLAALLCRWRERAPLAEHLE